MSIFSKITALFVSGALFLSCPENILAQETSAPIRLHWQPLTLPSGDEGVGITVPESLLLDEKLKLSAETEKLVTQQDVRIASLEALLKVQTDIATKALENNTQSLALAKSLAEKVDDQSSILTSPFFWFGVGVVCGVVTAGAIALAANKPTDGVIVVK